MVSKTEIVTQSGRPFDIKNFDINSIFIEDIAHGLSYICRYNGQCKNFYSVGEHSLNCLKVAETYEYSDELKLYTLLHDASEAYLCDIPTPLKKTLKDYKENEVILENLIYNRAGLKNISARDKAKVKDIDNLVFENEWLALMDFDLEMGMKKNPIIDFNFRFRDFSLVEKEFLEKSKQLILNISRR